jgi:hypothetical protein
MQAISAVEQACAKLKVFQLQTGYNAVASSCRVLTSTDYGTHLGGDKLAPHPWMEDSPRHAGQNFYYIQVSRISGFEVRKALSRSEE